jgi:hypothetical protein
LCWELHRRVDCASYTLVLTSHESWWCIASICRFGVIHKQSRRHHHKCAYVH